MEYKFVFQAVPERKELLRQVSQGMEKLTEMYSREKLPGLWKVTDRLNRAQEGKAPISSGRRNFPAGDGTGGLAAGHIRTDPRRPESQGTGHSAGSERGGVRCGRPVCSGYCSPGLWEC